MPDIFVPADTLERSTYLSELFFSGALNSFSFDLSDAHRKQLAQYGSVEHFMRDYSISEDQLQTLAKDAEDQGVALDPGGLDRSKDVIALRVKAGVARNIWGNAGYYRVLLSDDRVYDRARAALEEHD
jgi:carboxyl-terminal processing protease